MSICSSPFQFSLEFGIRGSHGSGKRLRLRGARSKVRVIGTDFSSVSQNSWSALVSRRVLRRVQVNQSQIQQLRCHCSVNPDPFLLLKAVKSAYLSLARSFCNLSGSSLVVRLAAGTSIVVFSIWGLCPLMQQSRRLFLRKSNSSWKRSNMYSITTSYVQPLLIWAGVFFICRALEPVVLASDASQIVKQRVINFVKSLSTMLVFAYCLSRITQQAQRFFTETNDPNDSRNMGFLFASRAIYTAVWVASVSLFMELLGFSTQKWLTAGGLGTVLLTLAGREILTNFLSSLIIHATRPFVLNEWIQTKIEGYEVSGTVERVGWWSPTIIRGDDREAIYIPNHKFTVTVLRNLSQKTHWRVKTHIAISHLDVGKINNIVADMRKVLAKNPQVEQQKLHRRVFLDDVNPENQALVIMISCFVKTSRFEEYLCVKEGILLDLLRVVSHHRARLATPVRTIQKLITGTPDLETQFPDSVFTHGAVSRRSLLLVEPSYKSTGDDKTRRPTSQADEDEESLSATRSSKSSTADSKPQSPEGTVTSQQRQDTRQPGQQTTSTSVTPSLEDNIVLGVALDGSKRTLPIDEEAPPSSSDQAGDAKELAALRSSNGPIGSEKEKSESKRPSPDQVDHQQDQ